ncbi:F0F1 ATP synthase subunit A [Stakelama pacifica]|uniref:ATP synthase subunit a n=1 Tax=Stakelama pacifica TaxID=517720 RepID=A0A4R6FPS2_9SPHN|nr:F0F1 ATP synthase subunit A [Stakelama pacifica]TDN83686.1 ATP synthase F0 subcomplex A subunit [Stakelama pacifica]GGO94522.1 ATP synthase subunit a [Stakelama pacifica]|tara:strand:- start:769 stop:1560 length:792 start_codon:yes stop_codon:yes gene_type:complete
MTVETGGKIDPMHQFLIEPVFGRHWIVGGYDLSFTNSALWMAITLIVFWAFMLMGMKGDLVPTRRQAAVESMTGFVKNMLTSNIGPEGTKFLPYVFSLFMFILIANILGLMPLGVVPGWHPFTITSHLTVTGVLAIISFSIVLIVGFGRHGFGFFKLFVPHGTPLAMAPLIFVVELMSFLVRPFSLGLRLFVAMTAGHILLKVLAEFVVTGLNAGAGYAAIVSLPSMALMIGITLLELLVAAIQAYVFALLTSVYLNDAVNLH